jgi:hypothetical protein
MIKLTLEEAKEKRHNPWHCKACGKLVYIAYGIFFEGEKEYSIPHCPICGALDVVEKKERETPEEFEARTGRPWDDHSAVYIKIGRNDWIIKTYREAKQTARYCRRGDVPYQLYLANSDAGMPDNIE